MKQIEDYKGILPYASELFGVYQPLLGWKSRVIQSRYNNFQSKFYNQITQPMFRESLNVITASMNNGITRENPTEQVILKPVDYLRIKEPFINVSIDSAIARLISEEIGDNPPADWNRMLTPERVTEMLKFLNTIITGNEPLGKHPSIKEYVDSLGDQMPQKRIVCLDIKTIFERENSIAGYLIFLAQHSPQILTELFFRAPKTSFYNELQVIDPSVSFGAKAYDAILSPIGIIHLYREYFFEFDSFLGPAVGHLWISPGGTVELIEVNTRKVFTEHTIESSTETTIKSDSESSTKDELSDAVKDENKSEMKFGFTNTASYTTPVFQDTAVASLSLDNAKMNARETTHKQMREQSEKLSSEIKRNFKTTFRTSTEVTDTTSKRYVIQNTTQKLVNYELRRKMRKIGVQVQDIGVQMCWHTFVDDPAKELGIANLIHIAAPADLQGLKDPGDLPMPENEIKDKAISLNIQWPADDNRYYDFLQLHPSLQLVPPKSGYIYSRTDVVVQPGGEPWGKVVFPQNAAEDTILRNRDELIHADVEMIPAPGGMTERSVRSIGVGIDCGHTGIKSLSEYDWNLELSVVWKPSLQLINDVTAANKLQRDNYNIERQRLFNENLFKTARDRVVLASKIPARSEAILREEERTVVYRQLIQQLMSADAQDSKHVVSELVRSIFDIDKMLYFVAPEWWTPRHDHLHRSQQLIVSNNEKPAVSLGKVKPKPLIPLEYIVGWGGYKEINRDNYYIADGSTPAKMGSSLGWLLQLDGDDLRNALLNSPWVKAVIPIRIGKEKEAINWLKQAKVEGSDGLTAQYVADPSDPAALQSTPGHTVTVEDALNHLITEIHTFDEKARTAVVANPSDPDDPRNHFVGSLPTEGVFEHGFYPLKGGVRFDQSGVEQVLVSQWTEILPTDQVAALEVTYDPKTLQIITPSDLETNKGDA